MHGGCSLFIQAMKEGGGDKDVEILEVGKKKEGFYFFLLSVLSSTFMEKGLGEQEGKTQAQDTPSLLLAWDRYDEELKSACNSSKWEPFIFLVLYLPSALVIHINS